MKPGGLAIALLSKKKSSDTDSSEGEDEESMPPLESVMQEFIDAVKGGDAKGAAKAFRGAMACSSDDEYDDE